MAAPAVQDLGAYLGWGCSPGSSSLLGSDLPQRSGALGSDAQLFGPHLVFQVSGRMLCGHRYSIYS